MNNSLFKSVLILVFLSVPLLLNGISHEPFPPFYIYKVSPNQSFTKYWFNDLNSKKISSEDNVLRIFIIGNWRLRHDVKKWAEYLKENYSNSIEIFWVFNPSNSRLVDHYERTKKLLSSYDIPVDTVIDNHSFVGRALRIDYNTTTIVGLRMNKLAFVYDSPLTSQAAKAVSIMIKHKLLQ